MPRQMYTRLSVRKLSKLGNFRSEYEYEYEYEYDYDYEYEFSVLSTRTLKNVDLET